MPRSARLLLVAAVAGLGLGTATPSHAVACNPLAQVVCQTVGYVCREVVYPIDQNVHMLACTWSA
jgi:hypothetical protein